MTKETVSDSRRVHLTDPGVPEECNIYAWHQLFSSEDEQQWAYDGCRNAEIGCFKCKKTVARNINELLEPIRERREQLLQQPDFVRDVLREGGKKSREIATQTLEETREMLGIRASLHSAE